MSGPSGCVPPRAIRRGAALTLVFAGVLATGAAAGTLTDTGRGAQLASEAVADKGAGPRRAQPAPQGGSDARELVSRSGDRWSAAYGPREYEDFQQTLDGRYVGVGLWIAQSRSREVIKVTRVQPGGPADAAGIRAGDVLRTVDGRKVADLPVTEVVARLRGTDATAKPGSAVALGLERDGRHWERTLQRARLQARPVTVDRSGTATADATTIKVTSFTEGSGAEIRKAARAARGTGVVLDLRGNSGGLVKEAVTAASAFLDRGVVATYDNRGDQEALYARGSGDTGTPMVVLVDGGTMSAAEMLAGALQDRGRAVVVGSRTFGKGTVQMPSEMPDGTVAELTVGTYRTPAGRVLEGTGVEPDLAVTGGADPEDEASRVLSGLGGGL
ncbi:S41 family peptidase [Streptomyces boninensis]|uniref:S41 family peptidase n=1 Tax=Streptomyces boninensis TaxID=2039455 RepID=UPI003B220B76